MYDEIQYPTTRHAMATMNKDHPPGAWQGWLRHPQRLWLRRALFQIHMWCGIGLGLYILFISVTGSVLVYRNELYVWAMADPLDATDTGSTTAFRLVTTLIELHKEFLAGRTGRTVNGLGACAVVLMVLTGLVLWWPGIARWRRSLVLSTRVGWKRFTWDLHSMVGIWSACFMLVFAVSGIYLCFPEPIHALSERLEPTTAANLGSRVLDSVLYWLAFLHFGRIDGIGLPCEGPGLCDQSVKAVWALFGLAPAFMFVTGATLWWQRVVRRRLRRDARPQR
jgi:uncharacterized iron-regulated membrane protein